MKTQAFLIRVLICFILSSFPVPEMENWVYSLRMTLRGTQPGVGRLLIVSLPEATYDSPESLARFAQHTKEQGAAFVVLAPSGPGSEMISDPDGVIRQAVLRTSSGEPSPAFLAFATLSPQSRVPRHPERPHWINYAGRHRAIPQCEWKQNSTCPPLKGRIVVLRRSGEDIFPARTPLGEMSWAEVQANDIHTWVNGRQIYYAGWIERSILVLAMILLGALIVIYNPVLYSSVALVLAGIALLVPLFQGLFYFLDLYIPSANITGSMFVTYMAFTGYRMAVQENLQWRNLKQSQYLRELDQMKTNFLTLVSHDLKTPVAKIQAMVDRMRKEAQLPPHERGNWLELVDSVDHSNQELKHFINSILQLSRIESQKVILNKKSNDPNVLVRKVLKRLEPLASQKNLKIEDHLEPLFSVEFDEDLIRQVFTNLVDNAIKFSPPGSTIRVSSREDQSGFVHMEVEDHGPGIPPDQLPLMFRKFNRTVRPVQEQVKGSGLGLYLSKYFIELHGGTIQVRSREGKGTTFSFTLPLRMS